MDPADFHIAYVVLLKKNVKIQFVILVQISKVQYEALLLFFFESGDRQT